MATAHKLPSGSWRVKVFDHYEYDENGKRHAVIQSFTSSDPSKNGKREAERMAAEWAYNRKKRPDDLTVEEAITKYIDAKRGVLSPSTTAAYVSAKNNHFKTFGQEHLKTLDDEKVQRFVSDLSKKGLGGKSVRNIYSLFASSVAMFGYRYKITLPQRKIPETYTPIDEEVNRLLDYCKEQGREDLYDCVMLSAFGSLRRGEIACLLSSDLTDNGVKITKDMIMDENKVYIIKEYAKTDASNREAFLPDFVLLRLRERGEGRLFNFNPHIITMRFNRALKKANCPDFRFHDLRHYWVSIAHALGMSEQSILDNGGWRTSNVMKRVYRSSLRDIKKKEQEKLSDHFRDMRNE